VLGWFCFFEKITQSPITQSLNEITQSPITHSLNETRRKETLAA
jgi:hypothetical protein